MMPDWMADLFDGLDDDPDTRRLVAATVAAEQCRALVAGGVGELHFYTLNRADLTYAICHILGVRPQRIMSMRRMTSRPPSRSRPARATAAWGRRSRDGPDGGRGFPGHENCTDILVLSRPDLVREIHARYFAAGADMVETNTFGASPLTLGEFGIRRLAFDINRRAVEIAREAAEQFPVMAGRVSSLDRSDRAPSCRRSAISITTLWSSASSSRPKG